MAETPQQPSTLQSGTSPVRADSDARDMRAAYAQCPLPAKLAYVYRSKLKWYILHPEQIETPQLHQARWWWRASIFCVDGVRFVGNGNRRVCAALLLRVCQPGPKRRAGLRLEFALQRSKSRGYG